jgi:hypothetical protein
MGSGAAQGRAAGPALVPVSVAAPDRLHLLAHNAATFARNVEDWWGSPIDTSLAAVALARHSRAYRDDAERTLERLLRWARDERPRRISADVTALALTARAAADLQRSDPSLIAAAAAAVDDLATRDRATVPELHLALCAWALDDLVSDRDQRPWPTLRSRSARTRLGGVDEPLARYVAALASEPFEANRLVQDLIAEIGSAPGVSETSLLLWLITAAAERLARVLPPDDNAFHVLVRQRAELVDRLAGEIDEQTFVEPTMADFGDEGPDDLRVIRFLSRFEALLLDIALAPTDGATPWVTFTEAESLFGAREREARTELASVRRRLLDSVAAVTASLALASGMTLWLGLQAQDVEGGVAYSLAAALASGVLVFAALALRRGRPNAVVDSLGPLFALFALLAALNAVNLHMKKPLVSDAASLIIGAAIVGVATVIWQVFIQLTDRERKRDP